jgi:nucleotide-binding universal stress UspA family protein
VIEALPRDMQRLVPAIGIGELLDLAAEERLAQLELLVAPERQEGFEIHTKVMCGRPFQEIIHAVLREGHDLVMMMAEEKGGLAEAVFGSTSLHLMRKCPCPVWVMSPAQRHKYVRVLAAVDPVTSDEAHQSLNIKILELAASLARIEGSELHVVHAWLPFGERLPILQGRLSPEEAETVAQQCGAAHERAFVELLREVNMRDLRVQVHLVKGAAGEVIPALAQSKHADVIVMGTVCRIGVAGLFIGNTAEKILRRVNCSVLTVKPEGFVTPVRLE